MFALRVEEVHRDEMIPKLMKSMISDYPEFFDIEIPDLGATAADLIREGGKLSVVSKTLEKGNKVAPFVFFSPNNNLTKFKL